MRHLFTALGLAAAVLAPQWVQAQPMGYPPQGRAILCESQDGGYRECATGFRGNAVLTENRSDTRCVEGGNWGNTGRGSVWVRTLPGGKLPDRSDFQKLAHAERVQAWTQAVAAAHRLADEFDAWLRRPDLARLLPL